MPLLRKFKKAFLGAWQHSGLGCPWFRLKIRLAAGLALSFGPYLDTGPSADETTPAHIWDAGAGSGLLQFIWPRTGIKSKE